MYDGTIAQDDEREDMLKEYLNKLFGRSHRMETEHTELFMEYLEGGFRRRPYPWMYASHRRRSDNLLAKINEEFVRNPANSNGDMRCFVKRNAFGEGVGEDDSNEVLGVFAATDMSEGDTILIDRTQIWGCNGPGTNFGG